MKDRKIQKLTGIVKHTTKFSNKSASSTGNASKQTPQPSSSGGTCKMNAEFHIRPPGCREDYYLHCWSISGLESCVSVRVGPDRFAFDMGAATRPSVNCPNVFITHGHVDHCGALAKHISQRDLRSQPPADYYCPPDILGNLNDVCQSYAKLSGSASPAINKPKLHPISVTQEPVAILGSRRMVRPFRTFHRVPSQGYVIYGKQRVVKEAFSGQDLARSGDQMFSYKERAETYEDQLFPEIAYTGDTTMEFALLPENAGVLRSRILIMEATYIDDRQSPQKARERGHVHLAEIRDNAHLFENVGALVIVHISDRYSSGQIDSWIRRTLPDWLRQKTWVPTLAKDMNDGF